MQDRGPIETTKVTQTARGMADVGPSSNDEGDDSQSESRSNREIQAETPTQVTKKGKGKAVDRGVTGQDKKTKTSCWWPPRKANIDFKLDVHAIIQSLKPGQLLTADQVYSAPEWHGVPPDHPRRNVNLTVIILRYSRYLT
jgi:hypothetical protein